MPAASPSQRRRSATVAVGRTPEHAFRWYLEARPRLRRGALILWCLLVVIGLSLGLSRAFEDAAGEYDRAASLLARAAARWQSEITAQISKATSLATAVAGFGVGDATGPIDHTANYSDRIRFNNETHWQAFAANLVDAVPGIDAFEVQPSGIVAHLYPPNPDFVGFDLLTFPVTAAEYRSFIDGGRAVIVGPAELLAGGIGLVTRFPAYVGQNKTFATFWGAGAVVFRLNEVFDGMNLASRVRATGYDLLAHTINSVRNPETTPPSNDVYSTSTQLTRDEACFSRNGLQAQIGIESQDETLKLFICLTPHGGLPSESPKAAEIASAVGGTLGLATAIVLVLLAAAFAAFQVRHRHVPHRSSAPTDVCIALVAVKDLSWWQERQDLDILAADLQRFEARLKSLAAQHGCHLSGRVSDGCVVVVSSSSRNMRQFGSACRRKLADAVGRMRIHAGEVECMLGAQRSSNARSRDTPARLRRHPSNAGTDHQSPSDAFNRSTSTRYGAVGGKPFAIACALHYGALAAAYSATDDHFKFSGSAITPAAVAIDATRGGELSFTEHFADLLLETEPDSTPAGALVRPLGDETVLNVVEYDTEEDEGDLNALSSDPDASGSSRSRRQGPTRNPHARGGGGGNDSSVLTAVSAVSGAVLSKRVALVSLELIVPQDDAHAVKEAAKNFPATLAKIIEETTALRGDIVSVHGTRVVIAFNALNTAAAPASKALQAVDQLRESAAVDGRWVAVATIGTASVATTEAGTCMCVGACSARIQALADRVLRVAVAEPHGNLLTTLTVIDAAMAEESKQSHELECLGTLAAVPVVAAPGSMSDFTLPSMALGSGSYSPSVTPRHGPATCDTPHGPPQGHRAPVRLLYAVHGPWNDDEGADGEDDGEWLYRLQSRESRSPFTTLNKACEAFAEGREADAAKAATDVLESDDKAAYRTVLSCYAHATLRELHAANVEMLPLADAPRETSASPKVLPPG